MSPLNKTKKVTHFLAKKMCMCQWMKKKKKKEKKKKQLDMNETLHMGIFINPV